MAPPDSKMSENTNPTASSCKAARSVASISSRSIRRPSHRANPMARSTNDREASTTGQPTALEVSDDWATRSTAITLPDGAIRSGVGVGPCGQDEADPGVTLDGIAPRKRFLTLQELPGERDESSLPHVLTQHDREGATWNSPRSSRANGQPPGD